MSTACIPALDRALAFRARCCRRPWTIPPSVLDRLADEVEQARTAESLLLIADWLHDGAGTLALLAAPSLAADLTALGADFLTQAGAWAR